MRANREQHAAGAREAAQRLALDTHDEVVGDRRRRPRGGGAVERADRGRRCRALPIRAARSCARGSTGPKKRSIVSPSWSLSRLTGAWTSRSGRPSLERRSQRLGKHTEPGAEHEPSAARDHHDEVLLHEPARRVERVRAIRRGRRPRRSGRCGRRRQIGGSAAASGPRGGRRARRAPRGRRRSASGRAPKTVSG